jgi:hypothetical protein
MGREEEPSGRWYDVIEMLIDKVIEFCENFDEGYFVASLVFLVFVAMVIVPFHCYRMPPSSAVESATDAYINCVKQASTDKEVCKELAFGKNKQ